LAVIVYLKEKKTDRIEKEYNTYHELDNRLFEYQKLALEYYDLDILDVPNNDPSLSFDKKRKQEMVAYSILFSLFERAYLMFSSQTDMFRQKQWSGWKRFLNDFLRRDSIRTAWQLSKSTYDTDFQVFMDSKIASVLSKPSSDILSKPLSVMLSKPAPEVALSSSPNLPLGTPEAVAANQPAA
jgi:hypothetical protein